MKTGKYSVKKLLLVLVIIAALGSLIAGILYFMLPFEKNETIDNSVDCGSQVVKSGSETWIAEQPMECYSR